LTLSSQVTTSTDNIEASNLLQGQTMFTKMNTFIDCVDWRLFSETMFLDKINLSRNKISLLPNGLLSGQKSLRMIDLSFNKLKTIDASLFTDLNSLSSLSLEGNPLTTMTSKQTLLEQIETKCLCHIENFKF
jgi:Leucine-rich repeat (LRR) protein